MLQADQRQAQRIFSLFGIVPVLWLGLVIAPVSGAGLTQVIPALSAGFAHPLQITFCPRSLPCCAVLLSCYFLTLLVLFSTEKNYRRREEHGSAKWGSIRRIAGRYRQVPKESNKILTQNVSIGYDMTKHRRNMNTLVIGGSGAGKTRSFVIPNALQGNTSFLLLDPKT